MKQWSSAAVNLWREAVQWSSEAEGDTENWSSEAEGDSVEVPDAEGDGEPKKVPQGETEGE